MNKTKKLINQKIENSSIDILKINYKIIVIFFYSFDVWTVGDYSFSTKIDHLRVNYRRFFINHLFLQTKILIMDYS